MGDRAPDAFSLSALSVARNQPSGRAWRVIQSHRSMSLGFGIHGGKIIAVVTLSKQPAPCLGHGRLFWQIVGSVYSPTILFPRHAVGEYIHSTILWSLPKNRATPLTSKSLPTPMRVNTASAPMTGRGSVPNSSKVREARSSTKQSGGVTSRLRRFQLPLSHSRKSVKIPSTEGTVSFETNDSIPTIDCECLPRLQPPAASVSGAEYE